MQNGRIGETSECGRGNENVTTGVYGSRLEYRRLNGTNEYVLANNSMKMNGRGM